MSQSVHIRLNKELKAKLEKKVEEDGFQSLSGFFSFLATNYVKENVHVEMYGRPWKASKQFKEQLLRAEQSGYSKPYENVDTLMKDLFDEDNSNKSISEKRKKNTKIKR